MKLYGRDSMEERPRLRLGANPLVQWFIMLWIGTVLYAYLNPWAGFTLFQFLYR